MNVKVIVTIFLLIAAVPVYAQAQNPSTTKVSKGDAEKVVTIISADKAKTKTYCEIQKLGEQMEQAYEKRNVKWVMSCPIKLKHWKKPSVQNMSR
jgi:hypothetical protein